MKHSMIGKVLNLEQHRSLPNPADRGRRGSQIWQWGNYRCHFQVNPDDYHHVEFLHYPYALCLYDQAERLVVYLVLEQLDYRELSALTKEPLTNYSRQRARHSPLQVILYIANERHELEELEELPNTQEVLEYFFELLSAELELDGEPQLTSTL